MERFRQFYRGKIECDIFQGFGLFLRMKSSVLGGFKGDWGFRAQNALIWGALTPWKWGVKMEDICEPPGRDVWMGRRILLRWGSLMI